MSTLKTPVSRVKSGLVLAVLATLGSASIPAAMQEPTLDPTTVPKYVTPLVIPPVMNNDGVANSYDIAVRQFKQQILPGGIWNSLNGRNDTFPATTVWSYGPAADPLPAGGVAPAADSQFNYPAYTVESLSNVPVDVRWINDLVDAKGKYLPHLLSIDQTVHWANPVMECKDGTTRTDCAGTDPMPYEGPVPIVTHVHGAHVEGHSDGYPEAWWLPAAKNIPNKYATRGTLFDDSTGSNPGDLGYADFHYAQSQPATTLWYHDHTLGMTRNNVYAGPAGFWLVRGGEYDTVDDTSKAGSTTDGVLPGPAPVAGQGVLALNVPGDPVRNAIREIPIVIQDRSFDNNGNLFYPKTRAFFEGLTNKDMQIPFAPDSDVLPIWNPEAFFNVMVVNGVSWPELKVAPALYRLRLLNGCNSRFLWLKVDDPAVEVYQIGAEQGFLAAPVNMNALDLDGSGDGTAQILMALAERADVIVDFRGLADGTVVNLTNLGPDEPFGGGIPGVDFDPADPDTTGQVMRFVVDVSLLGGSPTDPGGATPATDPADLALNAEPASTADIDVTRQLSLNEAESHQVCVLADAVTEEFLLPVKAVDCLTAVPPAGAVVVPFGPTEALLGIVDNSGAGVPLKWTDTTGASTPVPVTMADGVTVNMVNVTENPTLGDTEIWEIYNFTADAHPIHLHLVRFEVIDREVIIDGAVRSPEPWESGYKDTVISYPGEITRVKATFDLEGLYVWHCHIVEHEDNEMMRPFVVSAAE
ncbi:MAG: multicopper oxidase [Gammaproteobacteria bacterium]|jgi:FtsP/CotA-like multicopper oxidase with cupredoxin domain